MALRAIMLRKKIGDKSRELEQLRAAEKGFETREAQLAQDIEQAQTPEEQEAVEAAVSDFEKEKEENQKAQKTLADEIAAAEEEIRQMEASAPAPAAEPQQEPETRKENHIMLDRTKFFGMSAQERDAFFARDSVRDFLQRCRDLARQNRAVTNAELSIPDEFLGVIRQNITQFSKLIGKVSLRDVPGTSRVILTGTVPEAVWTEACGKLNEVSFALNQDSFDGFMVGAVIFLCNALLEDSRDLPLASEIITNLGAAVGLGIDKAIVYGTGVKMPQGIVTRLAQTTKPSDYSPTAREWVDLHTRNIQKLPVATGVKLYQGILGAFKATQNKFSTGGKFWLMNESTLTTLQIEAMAMNAAGTIVSAQNNTMPVIGGDIITLDFIPDNDIVAGYPDLYVLAQRAGMTLDQSEHVRWTENQTGFKATARYDGKPVIPEAFVLMNIANTAPSTSVSFAPDDANTVTPPTGGGT